MKLTSSATFLVGAIFSLVGGIFTILGIVFFLNLDSLRRNATGNGDIIILPAVFTGLGLLFLILGLCFVFYNIKKRNIIKKVMEAGNYVMAEVTGISANYSVRINGRHPYYVECHYFDSYSGISHIFKSENIFYCPPVEIGSQIRVYVEEGNLDHYYVDLSSVIGQVHFH